MITAKLIDHIWSTRKAESLNGLKLMQAEIIAVDAVVVGSIDENCKFE